MNFKEDQGFTKFEFRMSFKGIFWFAPVHKQPDPLDDVITCKHFPHSWPFVWGIHRSPVNSPHNGQWLGALMFFLSAPEHRLSKQSRRRWFETPSRSIWRHYHAAWIWLFAIRKHHDEFLLLVSGQFISYAINNSRNNTWLHCSDLKRPWIMFTIISATVAPFTDMVWL